MTGSRCVGIALVASLVAGCDALLPGAPAEQEILDGPIAGLSPTEQARHASGDQEFDRIFGEADGLGPIFVSFSCQSCHVSDGKGHPLFSLTRFGRMMPNGFDPMRAGGGPQLQHRAIQHYLAEQVPSGTTGVAVFMPPSVTGLGLLEAVADSTLLALEDSTDADADGISGRVQLLDPADGPPGTAPLGEFVARDPNPRRLVVGRYIGRFGRKAGAVNLHQQTVFAYREDIGITSDLAIQDPTNPAMGTLVSDRVPDPEIGSGTVSDVVFYLRTLKPPPRRDPDGAEVKAGETAFVSLGCGSCHRPTLTTGRSPIAALDRVTFHPYTDLLLHDMGPELDDGYTEGRAATSEWRTTPLWGLGLGARSQGGLALYLHDGRARSLREAIELHGGEAATSRSAFRALSADLQELVFRFLASL